MQLATIAGATTSCDLLQEIAEFIETENDESEYDEMEAHMDQPF